MLVIGGGTLGSDITSKFAQLADCPATPVVVIPTAGDPVSYPADYAGPPFLKASGCQVIVLHTRDRRVADTDEFAAPIRRAKGVFFPGGRQWRLVDSYLGTKTQRELEALLARGGIIAGTSAGATIQGSYLVRGAREGNQIMMASGYEEGFGFLRNVAVDQHLLKRNRQEDLVPVVTRFPQLLGIGIDEDTAILVTGNQFEVLGVSKVLIYEHGRPYYSLKAGDRFALDRRQVLR